MRRICQLIQIREKEQFGDVLWYSYFIVKTRLFCVAFLEICFVRFFRVLHQVGRWTMVQGHS